MNKEILIKLSKLLYLNVLMFIKKPYIESINIKKRKKIYSILEIKSTSKGINIGRCCVQCNNYIIYENNTPINKFIPYIINGKFIGCI